MLHQFSGTFSLTFTGNRDYEKKKKKKWEEEEEEEEEVGPRRQIIFASKSRFCRILILPAFR
jgi:hypothetical protein